MNTNLADDFIGQRQKRIDAVKNLRKLGIDPYPSLSKKEYSNKHILDNFDKLEGKEVILAGRMVTYRDHGKVAFVDIQDESGKIQIMLKNDELEENLKDSFLGWDNLKLLDIGDIVQVGGTVTKTMSSAISIQAKHVKLLAKCIRPIPAKIEDKEVMHRKRYLDLILHHDKIDHFKKVAQVTFAIREFLNDKGFLEIKTPILQPVYGGTFARPFKTHVHALNVDYYLAVAHELYLKRLITAGFENVYNLVGYFRNEGIDRSHNPEFTMIETMSAFNNYEFNMTLVEEMYLHIAKKVFNKTKFSINGKVVDLGKPWQRISMLDGIKKYSGYDFNNVKTLDEAHKILGELKVEARPTSIGESMKLVFEEKVEKQLIQPTFLTGHPVEISPLAKSLSSDPRFVERFEIYIGGMEFGDNWTELNDPIELFNRFKEQHDRRKAGNDEFQPMDIEFIEMMEYGMPPTTGLGPGVERLTMLLTEKNYIDDIIFFPIMRPAPVTEIQKKLYGEEYLMPPEDDPHGDKVPKVQADITGLPSRSDSLKILEEHVKEPYQILHAKMVAAAMQAYAKEYKENEDLWYITGLLHDLDYFEFPDEHPNKSLKWFQDWGYPKSLIEAVSAHAFGSKRTDTPPKTKLDFTLVACDEMSGLLYAYSLMRPTKFDGMEAKSALKRFKDKAFAAKIDREEIKMGVDGLGLELKDHAQKLIDVFNKMEEFK